MNRNDESLGTRERQEEFRKRIMIKLKQKRLKKILQIKQQLNTLHPAQRAKLFQITDLGLCAFIIKLLQVIQSKGWYRFRVRKEYSGRLGRVISQESMLADIHDFLIFDEENTACEKHDKKKRMPASRQYPRVLQIDEQQPRRSQRNRSMSWHDKKKHKKSFEDKKNNGNNNPPKKRKLGSHKNTSKKQIALNNWQINLMKMKSEKRIDSPQNRQ